MFFWYKLVIKKITLTHPNESQKPISRKQNGSNKRIRMKDPDQVWKAISRSMNMDIEAMVLQEGANAAVDAGASEGVEPHTNSSE